MQSQFEADGTAGCCPGGAGHQDGSPRGAAGDKKGFLEWAGARHQLLSSGCAGPYTQRSDGWR